MATKDAMFKLAVKFLHDTDATLHFWDTAEAWLTDPDVDLVEQHDAIIELATEAKLNQEHPSMIVADIPEADVVTFDNWETYVNAPEPITAPVDVSQPEWLARLDVGKGGIGEYFTI